MAVYTHLQDGDFHQIMTAYHLTLKQWAPIEAGASNSNYYLLTDQGEYVLTLFDESCQDKIHRFQQLLVHLERHNFPTSRLRHTAADEPCFKYKGHTLLLKSYVDGAEPAELTESVIEQIGEMVARLHQIPPLAVMPEKESFGAKHFLRNMTQTIDIPYQNYLQQWLAAFEQRRPKHLPRGLLHGDLFSDNVLFKGEKLRAIIDFEVACEFFLVFDLAMGLVGLYRDAASIIPTGRALVRGYQRVRKLEPKERETLQLWAQYAAVSISSWRFWKYHVDRPWPERMHFHWLAVEIGKDIGRIPPERFLADIFDSEAVGKKQRGEI